MDTLKAEQVGAAKWRVLAIPFYGPFKGGKDFDGEFFDRETDIKPRWFTQRPVIFHHGQDPEVKDAELGEQELDAAPTDEGWWGTIWLDRSNRYWSIVSEWLAAGKAFGSSGAIAHLVRKNRKTGHIDVWPHAEQTITLTPTNPFSRITASKAVADLSVIAADLRTDLPDPGDASADLGPGGDATAIVRDRAIVDAERLALRVKAMRAL